MFLVRSLETLHPCGVMSTCLGSTPAPLWSRYVAASVCRPTYPPHRPLRCPDERSLDVMGIAFDEQGIAELMCSVLTGGNLRINAVQPGLTEKGS